MNATLIGWLLASAWAGTVEVHVRDRALGDPIGGATISTDTQDVRGTTGPDGRTSLDLPDGPVVLVVVAEGFLDTTVEVDGTRPRQTVLLVARPGALEIVVEGLIASADTSRHVVDGEQAAETPGTLDDAVRLVQSLPGVTVQREYSPTSGDLSVRGSAPGDSRYFLDGVEIPYLYHFNQYASVFPASQIDTLELLSSTFSARFGDAVGAVVEARSRLDPPAAVHGGAHLNFVMGGADLAVPLAQDWWLGGSGRRSYQDLAGEQTDQYTVWPSFHDFVVRAEHGTADRGEGVFAFGAGDAYTRAAGELDVLDPFEASVTPNLDYHQAFQGVGAHDRFGGARAEGRVVGAFVHHRRESALADLGEERLDTSSATSRLDARLRPPGAAGLDLGYEATARRTALLVDPAGPDGLRVAEEAPALARGAPVDDALTRLQGGVYGTGHVTTGPVRWMPGLRLAGDSTIAEVQLEPRAAAQWRATDQTLLEVGGGRYTQRPSDEDLFAGTGDPDLPTTRSWQVSAGVEQTIANRLELGLDLYQKWLEDPLFHPIDAPAFAAARGGATGIELLTRYRLRDRFFLWGWVALQQTWVEAGGDRFPGDGDQLVSGGIVASWDVARFHVGARYRTASGLPFTTFDGSLYDAGNDAWIPIPDTPNGARLPAYHKLDLRLGYTIPLRGADLQLTAEVWMVPKSSAQLYPTFNYDYTEQGWVVGPTFLPLLGARVRF